MSTEIIKSKLKTFIIKKFKDSFVSVEHEDVGLIYVGNSLPYANSDYDVSVITDTEFDEKSAWDTMLIAKKINPGDVELVVEKSIWESGKKYKQFDDIVNIDDLMTSDVANNVLNMVVMNSEGNVYKCVSNNNSQISVSEPTNNYTLTDGFIETSDGYVWKYLYNIKQSNKFLTDSWMPVPFNKNNQGSIMGYDIDTSYNIEGSLNTIVVINGGNNYIHTVMAPSPYLSGSLSINLPNIDNVKVNMAISGVGILPETYITELITEFNIITLSQPITVDNDGTNNVSITTRIKIEGDGVDAIATTVLSGDVIEKIVVESIGTGYSKANVFIYGTSTDNVATARAILSPNFGHGYNPAVELASSNMMVIKRFGEIDSTENGLISNDISLRQYGLLMNPHKYNEDVQIDYYTSNNTISQTVDVTLESGSLYTLNDFVYQGSPSNPTFSANIVSQDSLIVKLTRCNGLLDIGSLLTNGVISRPVTAIKYPEMKPYSGEIMYINNIEKIQRADGQSEELKLIITV
ncbi:hypothetical protein M0R04_04125 [Candidatus Dojkabacteria bacterium]|jgi:hypothetical protein|nr:hypothetical protein [Candidatus Dojkabacteria bacterium]